MAGRVAAKIFGSLILSVLLLVLSGCKENMLRSAVEDVVEPHAAFSVSASVGSRGDSFVFHDESSGAISSWAWDFDADGSVDSNRRDPAPQVFTQAGYHDVVLKVSGPTGSDELKASNCIGIYGPGFSVDRVWAHTGEDIYFTDRSILASTISLWTWYWEWPAADPHSEFVASVDPSHDYTDPGQYIVSLKLYNGSTFYDMLDPERVHLDISEEHTLLITPDVWPADCQPLILAADLDGSGGQNDIVTTGTLQRKVYVWLNGVQNSTGSSGTISNWPRALAVGDINGDSHLDILSAASTGWIYCWENNGSGVFPAEATEIFGDEGYYGIYALEVGDIDGDDDMDVAAVDFAAKPDGKILWFENGNGWAEHQIVLPYDSPRTLACGDLDNDGAVDIVSGQFFYGQSGQMHCWLNNGSGTGWTQYTITGSAPAPISIQIADIDGDGADDVVAGMYGDNIVVWYRNLGGGSSWGAAETIGSTWGVGDVHVADLSGDSKPDVLVAGFYGDEIIWLENPNGSGDWRRHVVDGAFDGACSVYGADVDADGFPDVLGTARYMADKLAWWNIR